MLSFDELKEKLSGQRQGSGWLMAYKDTSGQFLIRGYGGMGTTIFSKLDPEHPFVGYLDSLLRDHFLQQQPFRFEYEANEQLAELSVVKVSEEAEIAQKT